jgi:hypothetical protein
MKLGKPLATGVAEERPSHIESIRPEDRDRDRSEPRERVRTERPEPAEAPAGR